IGRRRFPCNPDVSSDRLCAQEWAQMGLNRRQNSHTAVRAGRGGSDPDERACSGKVTIPVTAESSQLPNNGGGMLGDAPTDADLRRRVVTFVRDRVPPSWEVSERDGALASGASGADFALQLQAPGAPAANLRVDVRQTLARRDVAGLVGEVRDGGD